MLSAEKGTYLEHRISSEKKIGQQCGDQSFRSAKIPPPSMINIADVVGCFSGTIGYESPLFEHGDFKLGFDSFCPRRCTGTGSRTANDNEPLSV